ALPSDLAPTEPADALFSCTDPFEFFDYMRVPYRIVNIADESPADDAPVRWGRCSAAGGRDLYWLRASDLPGGRSGADGPMWGRYRLAGFSMFGAVLPDAAAVGALPPGHEWREAEPLTDGDGTRIASVRRDEAGNVALPFDPGEVMRNFWSERYLEALTSAT